MMDSDWRIKGAKEREFVLNFLPDLCKVTAGSQEASRNHIGWQIFKQKGVKREGSTPTKECEHLSQVIWKNS